MKLQPIYRDCRQIPQLREHEGVPLFVFPAIEALGIAVHGFSTRLGGVSEGNFSSMNFSAGRGDRPEAVLENFGRMAKAIGADRDRMVVSWQTHTANIRLVTEEDAGKGVIYPRDYRDVDGLITNVPGITLVTLYADCVPIYLVDPVKKAVGLCHSGWRGTVKGISCETIKAMTAAYGTAPADLTACIGPSICVDCFEVGPEVAEEFLKAFPEAEPETLCPFWKETGKYHVDLWLANELMLKRAGVEAGRIYTTGLCTRCNPKLLFSHRAVGEERGNLGAFLGLRP